MSGPSANGKKSILVVADYLNQDMYRLLSVEGETVEISIPKGVVGILDRCRPDVVVIDAGIDVSKSLHLLQKIKQACVTCPIIFIADECNDQLAGKSLMAGARLCLSKPISVIELSRAVTNLLRLKRSSRETRAPLASEEGIRFGESHEMLREATTDKPQTVLRAISYIRENLSGDVSLTRLAREANLSKFHFCRLFKKHIKLSPKEFVAYLRVQRAKELLTRDDLNVSMVSAEVGYNDASNFIRQFKKITGITPSDYKSSFKKILSTSAK
jgi:AraC-like DNA-binding protein/CheY-like chemotaxis protein